MKDMLRMVVWVLFGLAIIAAVQGCAGGQLQQPGGASPLEQSPGQAMIDQATALTATGGSATESAATRDNAQIAPPAGAPVIPDETFGNNFFPPDNQPDVKGFVDTQALTNSALWSENLKNEKIADKVAKMESRFKINAETVTGILLGCKMRTAASANVPKTAVFKFCEQFVAVAMIDGDLDLTAVMKEFKEFVEYKFEKQADHPIVYFKEPDLYVTAFPIVEEKRNVVIIGTKNYFMYILKNFKYAEFDSLKRGFLFVAVASVSPSEFDIFKTPLQQFKTVLVGSLVNEVFGVDFISPIASFAVKFDLKNLDYEKIKKFIAQKFEQKEKVEVMGEGDKDKEEIKSPEDQKKNVDTKNEGVLY